LANYSFEAKHNYFGNLRDEHKFVSIWSVYEVQDINDEPNFGSCKSVLYTRHWGKPVEVELPEDECTWLDLWKAAEQCIVLSNDNHHIFIEDFKQKDGKLELITGS
jgi:uncharacterized Fe-S cluster-containing protein